MIATYSRFQTVFGGAAGYIALLFFLLLVGLHAQELIRGISLPTWIGEDEVSLQKTEDSIAPATRQPGRPLSRLVPRPWEDGQPDIQILKQRRLLFPLRGMPTSMMKDTFRDPRGGGRLHEGVDILAPRNTPVVAIEDGIIGRLWNSKFGGITIYQFDRTKTYVYYYAHLEKYAPTLKEGTIVKRGQVIGYVGTSGNAPPNTPHLHFAIYKASQPGRWWAGTPINPYPVFG